MSAAETTPPPVGQTEGEQLDSRVVNLTAYRSGLARRARAAERVVPLFCPDCRSTYSDPWHHLCGVFAAEPSEAAVDAWAETIGALMGLHLTPVVPAPVARVLWRRGGRDRDLVAAVAGNGGVVE